MYRHANLYMHIYIYICIYIYVCIYVYAYIFLHVIGYMGGSRCMQHAAIDCGNNLRTLLENLFSNTNGCDLYIYIYIYIYMA